MNIPDIGKWISSLIVCIFIVLVVVQEKVAPIVISGLVNFIIAMRP